MVTKRVTFVGSQGVVYASENLHPQFPAELTLQLTLVDLETLQESLLETLRRLRRNGTGGSEDIVFEATLHGALIVEGSPEDPPS